MDGDGHPDRIVFVDQGEHVVALKPPIKTERRRTLCRLIVILLAAFGTSAVYIHHRLANKHTHRTEGPKTEGVVHAYFLLDRTGSMGALKNAVIDGYHNYVAEQQSQPGTMFFTVAQFDSVDPFELLVESAEIHTVSRRLSKYEPRDMTPLYDAMSRMIDYAERTSGGSDDVIICVFTDGAENASREATRQSVFAKVEEKKRRGWTFVFLGANQDAYATGGRLGYSAGATSNVAHTDYGWGTGWADVAKAMSHQRKVRSQASFSSAQRLQEAATFFDAAGARSAEAAAKAK